MRVVYGRVSLFSCSFSLSRSHLLLSFTFFFFLQVREGYEDDERNRARWKPLLISCDAALINSRRYSGVTRISDAARGNLYLALKGFARLINNEHRE